MIFRYIYFHMVVCDLGTKTKPQLAPNKFGYKRTFPSCLTMTSKNTLFCANE